MLGKCTRVIAAKVMGSATRGGGRVGTSVGSVVAVGWGIAVAVGIGVGEKKGTGVSVELALAQAMPARRKKIRSAGNRR